MKVLHNDEFKIPAYSLNTFPLFIPKGEKTVIVCIHFSLSCVRSYGRKMLTVLMSHKNFDTYLKQSVPSRDLIDVMARLKQKVSAWQEKCLLYVSADIANMRLNVPNLNIPISLFFH